MEVKVEVEVGSDLGGKEVASWVLKLVPSRWLVEREIEGKVDVECNAVEIVEVP